MDELQVLEDELASLRRKLDEAKRKRSGLRQKIGMARVQSLKTSLSQVRTGLEEKLMVLGERTEGRASEIEDKIGRLAKKSMQQLWTAVSSAGSSENSQLCQSPNSEVTQPNPDTRQQPPKDGLSEKAS